MRLPLVVAALSTVTCNTLSGIDDLRFDDSLGSGVGSTTTATGAATSVASSGGAADGAGGTGGSGAAAGGGGGVDCAGLEDPATKHCYLYVAPGANWADASTDCQQSFGGELAAIASAEELAFVLAEVGDATDWYIGGLDTTGDGSWEWVNGEAWGVAGWAATPSMHPWKAGEPNNLGAETVIELRNGLFESTTPDLVKSYFCERAP